MNFYCESTFNISLVRWVFERFLWWPIYCTFYCSFYLHSHRVVITRKSFYHKKLRRTVFRLALSFFFLFFSLFWLALSLLGDARDRFRRKSTKARPTLFSTHYACNTPRRSWSGYRSVPADWWKWSLTNRTLFFSWSLFTFKAQLLVIFLICIPVSIDSRFKLVQLVIKRTIAETVSSKRTSWYICCNGCWELIIGKDKTATKQYCIMERKFLLLWKTKMHVFPFIGEKTKCRCTRVAYNTSIGIGKGLLTIINKALT